jgi:biotin carboxyl carrier protein
MRWLWAAVAGVAFLGIVAGVVAVTVRVVQPTAVPQPIITMVPTPATPVTAPAAAAPPATPPAAAARLEGVLTVETTQVIANERGTIVDVAAVGAAIARNAPVAHLRKYSAAFEQAKARLAYLQAHFGKSPEHADFIEQARGDYLLARNRRQVLPVVTSVGGTITKIEVKAGQDYRANTVIAELAVARITVPVAAVDGTGTKCTAHLDNGKQLTGVLLAVGATERTLELDRMPTDASPGELGEVHIHCSDD